VVNGHCGYCLHALAEDLRKIEIRHYGSSGHKAKWHYTIEACRQCRDYLRGQWRYAK
jgi:hypothetical protein